MPLLFVLLMLCVRASDLFRVPEGYEDEEGFHYGREPSEK